MDEYYRHQAGSGIGGFQGVRYQKGSGFFGRFVTGSVLPILKKVLPYLGKTALNTGENVLSDLANGEEATSSIVRRLKESRNRVGKDAEEKLKLLTGEGRKRRNKRSTVKKKAKKRKPAKDFL